MQEHIWEKEYRDPKLVSLSTVPAQCVKDFVRYLRRECHRDLSSLHILDLGCGNGKNSLYISEQGFENHVVGIDISETALSHARNLMPQDIFLHQSIGKKLPCTNETFDIALDVTASNSLTEVERTVYISETHRVLKPQGYLFVRALCKDGDTNAKNLLKTFPGKEIDTYIMPGLGLTERVFSKEDFINLYTPLFDILYMDKETHYTQFQGKSFKRNFWVVALRKK